MKLPNNVTHGLPILKVIELCFLTSRENMNNCAVDQLGTEPYSRSSIQASPTPTGDVHSVFTNVSHDLCGPKNQPAA